MHVLAAHRFITSGSFCFSSHSVKSISYFSTLTVAGFTSGLYQMSVPENAPVGSVVGRIWAKDRDIGINAEMTYSIIDGDGRDTFDISTDPTNMFGIITVKRVKIHIIDSSTS